MKPALRLSELTTLRKWQLRHVSSGGELFRTFASLEWFIRQHRQHLVDQGVLIPQSGSRATLVTSDFDNAVCNILTNGASA